MAFLNLRGALHLLGYQLHTRLGMPLDAGLMERVHVYSAPSGPPPPSIFLISPNTADSEDKGNQDKLTPRRVFGKCRSCGHTWSTHLRMNLKNHCAFRDKALVSSLSDRLSSLKLGANCFSYPRGRPGAPSATGGHCYLTVCVQKVT